MEHWFMGLGFVVLLGPPLVLLLPALSWCVLNAPGWFMPIRPTLEDEGERLNPLQTMMFEIYRLLMPYNYLIE